MTHYLAYLDAGSGSLLIQALVAGAAGAAVFFKLGWRRLTGAFRKQSRAADATVASSGSAMTTATKGNE